MKRKLLPPFIMLTAGLITSIRTFCLHYDMKSSLIILLVVLVAFSRIVAGAHFLTDVVFSMIIVLSLVILADYLILQKMLDKSNQMEYN